MKSIYLLLLFILFSSAVRAGEKVKGYVYDERKQPIIGANVYWEGSQNGTTTDTDGFF